MSEDIRKEIIENLVRLPDLIKGKEIELFKSVKDIDEVKYKLAFESNECFCAVNSEKVMEGKEGETVYKPKYTNDKARESEVKKRLAVKPSFVKLQKDLVKAGEVKHDLEIGLRRLQSREKNYRSLCKLLGDGNL